MEELLIAGLRKRFAHLHDSPDQEASSEEEQSPTAVGALRAKPRAPHSPIRTGKENSPAAI